ncbi:hypothetical protein RI129_012693 [Pyrocoelia pectoralis]|uniref:N-acyl-aliphatic-L-amino acid amidohydrolase n=1 Tax=Pyrocoelia pectoralis TaxID=417401 RepID=A0AAN7UZW7_9COLE
MDLDKLAIENFRKYLRIPTVQPNVNYEPAVSFLETLARDLDLPIRIYQYHPDNPIVLISWIGTEPELPSILLNSHMDMVPVNKTKWKYDPFGAEMDEYGNIHGRGAQDCKSVGMLYVEAIRRLKQSKVQLRRTVHVLFVPDEEVGGTRGMKALTVTEDFRKLNVGFAIDEGFPDEGNKFLISYAEKIVRQFVINCEGTSGHGSLLLQNTAGEKLASVLTAIYNLRKVQKEKLAKNTSLGLGNIIAINLTKIEGGLSSNIIPLKFSLTFDCRLPPDADIDEFDGTVSRLCQEAGSGITVEFLSERPPTSLFTTLDDSNRYWVAFKQVITDLGIPFETWIYSATTDGTHLRKSGTPTIGFVPFRNTPFKKHAENEFLNARTFLEGIDVYTKLLPALANV